MNLDTYHCSVNPATGFFEFYSEGPNGKIKKVVSYQQLQDDIYGMQRFNLCFGDWDEGSRCPNDASVTNNGDVLKVLATVAGTVITFTDKYPGCLIQAEGSTSSRTRLYQMKMKNYWEEIKGFFNVKGYFQGSWEVFRLDRNYEAFVVSRK
ncbi:DUF6934 family protein [Chitinophaga pinensis]|uniref:Uncharacterized protein n=1 Tax=Chitinophaga pinensis TaxID=79329 RepID=A0A5C6M1G8_9BACT|nr:hypothetical protein [Chitinophaga pinensis]TWW01526.1 hypothetical protein FEF09_05890 [Chitinophaga pinensis]